MPTEKPAQSKKSNVKQKNIDLNKLAEKIIALLLRELEMEKERTGR